MLPKLRIAMPIFCNWYKGELLSMHRRFSHILNYNTLPIDLSCTKCISSSYTSRFLTYHLFTWALSSLLLVMFQVIYTPFCIFSQIIIFPCPPYSAVTSFHRISSPLVWQMLFGSPFSSQVIVRITDLISAK